MILPICLAVLLILGTCIYFNHKRKNPKKIFGVYTQPGKWFYLKYVIFLTILTLRKLKYTLGYGVKRNIEQLEALQPLSNHEKAIDAVFFQGVSKHGYYLCGGLERRHEGKANGLFYIVVPGVGLLSSEKLPNTLLDADPVSLQLLKEYSAGGIRFTPVTPMKKWRVAYEGNMRIETAPEKTYRVKLEAEWTSIYPYFFYEDEISSRALARAIATEKWTKEFFEMLKLAHQSHYEQTGKLRGKLFVDGKEHIIDMDAFRDHSFAHKRDWSIMHRYIFNMIYLENGSIAVVGIVSQPCTTSQLELGYILTPEKIIHAIEYCNLKLYQHGEKGRPPKDYGFTFMANGYIYDVKAFTEHEAEHFKGHSNEARLIERFMRFEVNSVKGRGISEWHYNNIKK